MSKGSANAIIGLMVILVMGFTVVVRTINDNTDDMINLQNVANLTFTPSSSNNTAVAVPKNDDVKIGTIININVQNATGAVARTNGTNFTYFPGNDTIAWYFRASNTSVCDVTAQICYAGQAGNYRISYDYQHQHYLNKSSDRAIVRNAPLGVVISLLAITFFALAGMAARKGL